MEDAERQMLLSFLATNRDKFVNIYIKDGKKNKKH